MDSETKRHIDAARQVLVGVVPNPASQIDQITNALIYKFMDDMDQAAIKLDDKPSFFVDELEKYSWVKLMDPRKGNQERMNLYSEALLKFSESDKLPPLFREIFKSAFLPYRSPEVLDLFLKEIAYFDYSHSEELGNAYEYLLSIMSSQGDAGQFRTPRHIIDFIVAVVDPKKDDKVLDPACGTAGFLISAYKHILSQHDSKNPDGSKNEEKPLTPDEKRALLMNFEGYDIDPGMVRIAQVNMYLHQFKNPKIYSYNTLADEDRWKDKFDIILANPPFMSPKGGVKTHNKFTIESSRSEVLFVDYIMNHLRPGGRAGVIVPEGIIFQSGKAHTQLRKNLVEDGLWAVISLPQGVFSPYAGVKTSVLIFDTELSKHNKEIIFFKVLNDGYDLGATKRPINKNDLSLALAALRTWKEGSKIDTPLVMYVDKSRIINSGDFNLSMERYGVAVDYSDNQWPMIELGELCILESGSRQKGGAVDEGIYSIGGEQISENNEIRFQKMKYVTEDHFKEMKRGLLSKGDVLMVKDGATTGKIGFWNYEHKAAVNEHVFIFRALEKVLPKYLFYILLSDSFQNELRPYIRGIIGGINLEVKKIKIPVPPIQVQEQLIEELNGYSEIASGARQIINNWKPKIEVQANWEKYSLQDACEKITDGTHKTPVYTNEGVPFLRVTDITESNDSKKFISQQEHQQLITRCKPQRGDVLYSKNGTIGIAKLVDWDWEFSIFVSLALLRPKKDILNSRYLELFLNSDLALSQAFSRAKSGTVTNLHLVEIKQFIIPIPSMETQKEIVDKIEAERVLIDGVKKIIKVYEKRAADRILKIWQS